MLILDQDIEQKVKENIQKLQNIYNNLGTEINVRLMEGLKNESNVLLFVANRLKGNEEKVWTDFYQVCTEVKRYQPFWKVISEEVIKQKEKRFLQRSLEVAQLVRQVKQEKDTIDLNFSKSSDLSVKIRNRLWEIIQSVPSEEGEEELWLTGDSRNKLKEIKQEWTKEIVLGRIRKKLELLKSLLSGEDEFVHKLTKLLNEYNNKTNWEASELEIHEKELENEIAQYQTNSEKLLFSKIYRFLKENFITQDYSFLKSVSEKILKITKELRKKTDWNKRHEIQKDVRKEVWIICVNELKSKEVVDDIMTILKNSEEEMQDFSHKYKKIS